MEPNPTQPAGQQPTPGNQKKSSSNAVVIIIAVVVVLLIAGLVGGYFVFRGIKARVSQKIGQSIGENVLEKAIEQGTGQKVDVDSEGDSVSVKTDSGTWSASETGNIPLPSDFPSDIFTYPDAKITFATTTPANASDGTKASFIISYTVNQSFSDVVTKYKAEMAKNGWIVGTEANYGAIAMMIDFKKGNKAVTVDVGDNAGHADGITKISITVSEN